MKGEHLIKEDKKASNGVVGEVERSTSSLMHSGTCLSPGRILYRSRRKIFSQEYFTILFVNEKTPYFRLGVFMNLACGNEVDTGP